LKSGLLRSTPLKRASTVEDPIMPPPLRKIPYPKRLGERGARERLENPREEHPCQKKHKGGGKRRGLRHVAQLGFKKRKGETRRFQHI